MKFRQSVQFKQNVDINNRSPGMFDGENVVVFSSVMSTMERVFENWRPLMDEEKSSPIFFLVGYDVVDDWCLVFTKISLDLVKVPLFVR